MPSQKLRNLLTVKQTSEYLNVHVQTLYDLVERKEIPHIRLGRSIRFDLSEVIEHHRQDIQPKVINYQPPIVMVGGGKILTKEELKMRKGCSSKSKQRLWNIESGTITTKPQKNGVVRYYGENYKVGMKLQVLKHARNFEEAAIELNDRYDNVFRAKYGIAKKQKRIRLSEFIQENKLDSCIRGKVLELLGDKWLDDITELEVLAYVRKREKVGARNNTVNSELIALRKTLNLAKRSRHSIDDQIKWGNCLKTQEFRDRVLRDEDKEEERLMPELAEHLKLISICALNTGMRRSEILSLKWKNIVDGKIVLEARNTKTKRQRRISINSILQQVFEILKSRNGSDFVFTYGGKKINDVQTGFSNACRRAGIEDLQFRDLRRTFATRLMRKGVGIYTISKLLGHASVTMTEKYLNWQPEDGAEAVESLVEKPLIGSKMDEDEQFQLPLVTSRVS